MIIIENIILIEAIIIKLQEFEINIERENNKKHNFRTSITNWATTILSNSANFISKFLLVVIITLFLL